MKSFGWVDSSTKRFLGKLDPNLCHYSTVYASKLCRYIGQLFYIPFCQVSIPWSFRTSNIFFPIDIFLSPYMLRYMSPSLASIKMPPILPSGFFLPLCNLLNLLTSSMTSSRVGKPKCQSRDVILLGAWFCLTVSFLNYSKVKRSVQPSLISLCSLA